MLPSTPKTKTAQRQSGKAYLPRSDQTDQAPAPENRETPRTTHLGVCVEAPELHAGYALLRHPHHGVTTPAAHAHHLPLPLRLRCGRGRQKGRKPSTHALVEVLKMLAPTSSNMVHRSHVTCSAELLWAFGRTYRARGCTLPFTRCWLCPAEFFPQQTNTYNSPIESKPRRQYCCSTHQYTHVGV